MKMCPNCFKTFDNSWGVCLYCRSPLVDSELDKEEVQNLGAMKEISKGFFGKFSVSDNYEYIAVNIKTIYDMLNEQYANIFENEKHLYMTCGAIDVFLYLKQGNIKVQDLERAYMLAKTGTCMLDLRQIQHEEPIHFFSGKTPDELLVNYILQLECLIFDVDSPELPPNDIMHAVISMKSKISKLIQDFTPMKYAQIYSGYKQIVKEFIISSEFSNLRTQIKEKALSEKL